MTSRARRPRLSEPSGSEGANLRRADGAANSVHSNDGLTRASSSADDLPQHVRRLLDWLVDEELKRWQRETQ